MTEKIYPYGRQVRVSFEALRIVRKKSLYRGIYYISFLDKIIKEFFEDEDGEKRLDELKFLVERRSTDRVRISVKNYKILKRIKLQTGITISKLVDGIVNDTFHHYH